MHPLRVSARASLLPALFFATLAVFPAVHARAEELDSDADAETVSEEVDDEDEADDPIEEHKRDEADRAYLAGKDAGSLATPMVLKDEAQLEKMCAALQGEKYARPDADLTLLAATRRSTMRDVYTVFVPPSGFKLGDYQSRRGKLPIRIERPLIAVDGAVRLIVAHREGAVFEVPAKDAAAIHAALEEKKIGLEVVFRGDQTICDTLSPCFSYPKSAAYALNIEPLSIALVEVANRQKHRAELKMPALDELKSWMDPGKARLAIIASSEGPVDSDALTKAIEAKRVDLEACFGGMIHSASGTGMIAYEASVNPSGAVTDVRVEAESLDDDDMGTCAAKVLAMASVNKAAKGSVAHVALSIERGEDVDAPMITD